jgi:hypothetical protein
VINYTKESQHPQYGKIRDRNLDKGDFVFALGRDVYEPQVSLPQEPEEVDGFDFGDIENRKKKRQEDERKLTKIKVKWAEWQKKFDAAYDEALKYDKDTDLKAGDKAKVWKRLANSFSQDNPYSTEDQLIRSKAVERMEYWRNYREPTPPETIRQEPSDGSNVHDNLPQSYSGSFQWHGSKSIAYLTISINNILTDLEDNVIAEGNGFYEEKGHANTDINIKIKITPSTLRFEMWEMNPTGSDDFVTDGSHVGTISNDLKSIQAVWTTKGSGEQGDLKLKAK